MHRHSALTTIWALLFFPLLAGQISAQEDFPKAVKQIQPASGETKPSPRMQRYRDLSEQAAKLEKAGNYEKAAEIYKETLPLVPEIWAHEPYERLGRAYYHLGRYQEAVKAYQEAMRLFPEGLLYLHFRVGEAFERLGDRGAALNEYKTAVEAYKKVIRSNPDDAHSHMGLGEAFECLGDKSAALDEYKIAVEAYKKTIRSDPDLFFFVHFGLGLAYIRLGDRGTALGEYKTLKTRNPELAEVLFGEIYKEKSQNPAGPPR